MPICIREIIGNNAWGRQLEVPCDSEEFHCQLNAAVVWIKAHAIELKDAEYICDIGFQHEKSENVIFGYTIQVEQMKVFVDLNITLLLSRLRDDN